MHPISMLMILSSALTSIAVAAVSQDVPPPGLAGAEKTGASIAFSGSPLEGVADYLMAPRKIQLQWSMPYDDGFTSSNHQEESVPFWPTEVASAGPGRLVVAGKSPRTGHTILELWTFALPDPAPVPYVDPSTGAKRYPALNLAISEKVVLYDAAEAGRELVRAMLPVGGGGEALFVLFEDSRDLYSFDLESLEPERILSSSPNEDVPTQPALANDYVHRWGGEHMNHGYVYFLSPLADRTLDILALFDRDRDGEIDEHRTIPRDEFHAMGLSDGLQYLRYW